jgi:soluble lytic murein transglycosylase-like protein
LLRSYPFGRGNLAHSGAGAGVTAGDITDMISSLRGDLGKGGIEGRNAERAINHLQDMLDTHAPDAGAAARQMNDAYAARSRMLEGMQEGHATRIREDVQVGTSRRQARKVRNAYDSAEGFTAARSGKETKFSPELGGSPEEALRATVKQSRGSTSRQIAQNIGPAESDLLTAAARAQDESAQALAAASNKAQSGSGDGADAEMLVQAIAGLHPSSFITTKASAMRKLLDMTYIPESRARAMVDMLFSQDSKLTNKALKAIGNEPNGARFVKFLSRAVGQGAASFVGALGEPGVDDEAAPAAPDAAPSVEADLAAVDQPAGDQAPVQAPETGDSPYAAQLQQIYSTENPDLLDLIGRVKAQESSGDQSAVSKKGAVGVMQVMPDTGPEAAALAGVPWDENAYHNDAAYNELIGIAYLSELLRKYDGDVTRALAAYNAGPNRTDHALNKHGDQWLAAMPAETRDYVTRIGT